MLRQYKKLEKIWFSKVPEKTRYLLVGAFNTMAAYLIFVFLYFLLRGWYGGALVLQNIISINISILAMRRYAFKSRGDIGREYGRALAVYCFMIAANYPWLYVFDKVFGISAPVAQPAFIILSAIAMYLLHKYFSFRKM